MWSWCFWRCWCYLVPLLALLVLMLMMLMLLSAGNLRATAVFGGAGWGFDVRALQISNFACEIRQIRSSIYPILVKCLAFRVARHHYETLNSSSIDWHLEWHGTMRIIKPELIGHFDIKKSSGPPGAGGGADKGKDNVVKHNYAVYSLDFQPNSFRLATAGGDCAIKIWNAELLLRKEKVTDAMQDESLLATLTNHTKSVNIVRWSKDGEYLASGSDDAYVLIYKHTPGQISNQSFGSKSAKNVESWSRVYTLQGHTMDVLDLDWSVNGVVASASVDNTINIWNPLDSSRGNKLSAISPFKVLEGHKAFVKGICFDPVGRYLVSSGADNLVIIWDCENSYACAKVILHVIAR
jgi:WD40 repeat protein